MRTPLPPIDRDCRRLLVHTEEMVRRFSRYHKYTVGTDLRQAAMDIMRTVNQAVHDRPFQHQHVQALVWRVDEYRLTLQLGMDVGVLANSVQRAQCTKGGATPAPQPHPSFHAFEQAADLTAQIGKQCGGWHQALARHQCAMQAAPSGPPADAVAACHAAEPTVGAGPLPQPLVAARPASLSGRASLGPQGTGGTA